MRMARSLATTPPHSRSSILPLRTGAAEIRRAFGPSCGQSLGDIGAGEAEEFEGERAVEDGSGRPKPVVERVLGPADRGRRPRSELSGHLEGPGVHLAVGDAER